MIISAGFTQEPMNSLWAECFDIATKLDRSLTLTLTLTLTHTAKTHNSQYKTLARQSSQGSLIVQIKRCIEMNTAHQLLGHMRENLLRKPAKQSDWTESSLGNSSNAPIVGEQRQNMSEKTPKQNRQFQSFKTRQTTLS